MVNRRTELTSTGFCLGAEKEKKPKFCCVLCVGLPMLGLCKVKSMVLTSSTCKAS